MLRLKQRLEGFLLGRVRPQRENYSIHSEVGRNYTDSILWTCVRVPVSGQYSALLYVDGVGYRS